MTATIEDYATAQRVAEILRKVAKQEIDRMRPAPVYAEVTSVDRPQRLAYVKFPGQTDSIPVTMGSIEPKTIGQIARIEGTPGDRYMADVMGEPYLVAPGTDPSYVSASIYDAVGDLVVGSGQDSYVRLPVGSNNQVLTADSAVSGGIKWAAVPDATTVSAGTGISVTGTPPNFIVSNTGILTVTGTGNIVVTAGQNPSVSIVNNPTFSGLVTAGTLSVTGAATFSSTVNVLNQIQGQNYTFGHYGTGSETRIGELNGQGGMYRNGQMEFDANGNAFRWAGANSSRMTLTGAGILRLDAAAGSLDLSATGSTLSATGTGVGDKIAMYLSTYGFGLQAARLVAFVDSVSSGFAVRVVSASGQKSSGTDAHTFLGNGNATHTGTLSVTGFTYAQGNLDVAGDTGKSIYTWDSGDTAWRIGMSNDNGVVGFTRKYLTSHVNYAVHSTGATQGFAVGTAGGLSAFEIRGSDQFAYFRGVTQIENKFSVTKTDGTTAFILDPTVAGANGGAGTATFPSQSLSGDVLIDGSITSLKISLPGIASIIASGAGNNTANSFFRFAYTGNSYIDPPTGAQLSGLTPQNTATVVSDQQAYQAYAIQIPSTVANGTVGQDGPSIASLPNGIYDFTVFVRVSANTSGSVAATFDVTTTAGTAIITGTPSVKANELSTTGYMGYKFSVTLTSATGIQVRTKSGNLVNVFVSHITGIPVTATSTPGVKAVFTPNIFATAATISSVSATSLVAGEIKTDDVWLGVAGMLWAGAARVSGVLPTSRLEFKGGGTDASRGIFAYSAGTQTVALKADGTFQLRGASSSSYVNMTPTLFQMFYNNSAMITLDASNGSAAFVGSVTAASGTIGGFSIGATDLFAGSGATRVQMSSNGANGGFWAGADARGSAPFSVTPLGVLLARSGTVGGFTITSDQFYAGSGVTRIMLDTAVGIHLGDDVFANAPFSVTRAGVLKARSGTIGGWTLNTAAIQSDGGNIYLDKTGYIGAYWDSGNSYVLMDGRGGGSTGLRIFKQGVGLVFNADINGNVSITGTINANAGNFTGNITSSATITGGTFQGGTFQTASSGARVIVSPASGRDISFWGTSSTVAGYIDTSNYNISGVGPGAQLLFGSGRTANDAAEQTLTLRGGANGGIISSGYLTAGTTISAQSHITSNAGNITASVGNIIAGGAIYAGAHAVLGTSVLEGFYMDALNIAIRTRNQGSSSAIYFQGYNGAGHEFRINPTSGLLLGRGLQMFAYHDGYLRINESNPFSSGVWFGASSVRMGRSTSFIVGSDGGDGQIGLVVGGADTTRRITLNGENGKLDAMGGYVLHAGNQLGGTPILFGYDSTAGQGLRFYINSTATAVARINAGKAINANITGTADKAFIIDHPSPGKTDKWLKHVCLEGPTADVYYRGRAQLTFFPDPSDEDDEFRTGTAGHGAAVVVLPDYFEDLTRREGRTVQLTPILGCDDEDCPFGYGPGSDIGEMVAPSLAAGEVYEGAFIVRSIGGFNHGCASFYWEVKAIRNDVPHFDPEVTKADYDRVGDGPYTYLTPRA